MENVTVALPEPITEKTLSLDNSFGDISNERGLLVANSINHGQQTQIGSQVVNNYASSGPHAIESERRKKIVSWLSPLDYRAQQRGLLIKVAQGSCQWFLSSQQFLSWKNRQTQYLWCSGRPGAGKSFLSSIVINELKQSKKDCQVAFLFLSYKQKPTLNNLLGSLVKQLVSTPLPPCLQDVWNEESEKPNPFASHPDLSQLEELLSKLASASDTFIVVDALDESDISQRQSLLDHLRRIKNANILVTSRDQTVRGFESVEIMAHQEDIHGYIEQESARLSYLTVQDENLKTYIKRKVTEKAYGIFLLVRCHMEVLAALESCGEVPDALEKLPSNPDSMYTSTLQRISDLKRGWAMAILGWIVHAFRPLELEELRHALLIGGKFDQPLRSGDADFDHSYMISREEILSFCCGLVEIENSDKETVKLIHFTAQEFFEKSRSDYFQDFHARAAFACAKYLCIPRLARNVPQNIYTNHTLRDGPRNYVAESREYERLLNHHKSRAEVKMGRTIDRFDENAYITRYTDFMKDTGKRVKISGMPYSNGSGVLKTLHVRLKLWLYPFVTYTGKYLAQHLRNAQDENRSPAEDQIRMIWDNRVTLSFHEWLLDCMNIRRHSDLKTLTDYAAFFGSPSLVAHYSGGQPSGSREKALEVAVSQGCSDVVRTLLTNGPLADLTRVSGHRLLLSAAQNGSLEAVKHVVASISESLDRAKEYHKRKTIARRTIDWIDGLPRLDTSKHDHLSPSLSIIENENYIRLLSASPMGDVEELRRLLEDIRIEMDSIEEITDDLFFNLRKRNTKRFVEIEAKNLLINTSFFLCVETCHTEAVEVFLDCGVRVDQLDYEQQTPLYRAVYRNSAPMVEMLLQKRASMNLAGNISQTVWTIKTGTDQTEVLKILLSACEDFGSILYAATRAGDAELVKLALDFGADPSRRETHEFTSEDTPLHVGISYARTECVKLLLEHGADLSARDRHGRTPLQCAVSQFGLAGLQLLLNAGASVNSFSKEDKAVLEQARATQ